MERDADMISSIIEISNNIGAKYGGILGLTGFITGMFGLVYGFYSRNNPKRPKHRISYKAFGLEPDLSINYISQRFKKRNELYTSYIDIWNSGSETISVSTVRNPLTIGAQRKFNISEINIDKESHPSVSNFKIENSGQANVITWSHFDPGMCARLKIVSKTPIPRDNLVLFGSGYRMDIKRIPTSTELSGPIDALIAGTTISINIALASVFIGSFLLSGNLQKFNHTLVYFMTIPAIAVGVIIVLLCIATPIFLMLGVKQATNPKSPIEKEIGHPDTNFGDDFRADRLAAARYERRQALRSGPSMTVSYSDGKKAETQPGSVES